MEATGRSKISCDLFYFIFKEGKEAGEGNRVVEQLQPLLLAA